MTPLELTTDQAAGTNAIEANPVRFDNGQLTQSLPIDDSRMSAHRELTESERT